MRVEIRHRCSSRYKALLRVYCGMTALTALCASVALGMCELDEWAFAAEGICGVMCCAAAVVPMSFGRISYLRSGGCIKIEKGFLTRRTLIINRSDIHGSEIRRSFPERRLGLCTVVFFTGRGKVRLRGIELDDGRLLDSMLRPVVS